MTDNNERPSSSLSGATVAKNDTSRPESARSGATLEGEAFKTHAFKLNDNRFVETTIDFKEKYSVGTITNGEQKEEEMDGLRIFRGEAGIGDWNIVPGNPGIKHMYIPTEKIEEDEWDHDIPKEKRRLYEDEYHVWRMREEDKKKKEHV